MWLAASAVQKVLRTSLTRNSGRAYICACSYATGETAALFVALAVRSMAGVSISLVSSVVRVSAGNFVSHTSSGVMAPVGSLLPYAREAVGHG